MHAMLVAGIAYLLAHFCAYAFWLRRRDYFQREIAIFLYHLISATFFTIVVLSTTLILRTDASIALGVALVAAHGIYSISFLELWSLTEGSYSISILNEVARNPMRSRAALIGACAKIGLAKKADRLAILSRFAIAIRRGECWQLTTRGRYLSSLFRALNWLTATDIVG